MLWIQQGPWSLTFQWGRDKSTSQQINAPDHFLIVSSVLKKINQGNEINNDKQVEGTLNWWSEKMTFEFEFKGQDGARHARVWGPSASSTRTANAEVLGVIKRTEGDGQSDWRCLCWRGEAGEGRAGAVGPERGRLARWGQRGTGLAKGFILNSKCNGEPQRVFNRRSHVLSSRPLVTDHSRVFRDYRMPTMGC